MQFINPLFLFALGTLAIPILIHLFNFRKYKKVYFTNVHFLRELQLETKKQSRLKQLLILLARLLAIASLVFAFAQPYIPVTEQEKALTSQRAVSIYLDNSFSMEAIATEGKLIELARSRALEIVSAYDPSDLFQLLTNDFEGKHQRFVSRDDLRKMVEEVQLNSVTRSLAEVISHQNELLAGEPRMGKDAYLVSDFQKTTASLLQAKPDSAVSYYLVPLAAEKRDNLFIDTIYFASPVHQPLQPVTLRVRIRNTSSGAIEKIPVKLTVNGVQKAIASFSAAAGTASEVTMAYTENPSGIQYGLVEITDYPVVYDDQYYFCYTILPSIPVLTIDEKQVNPYLGALFGTDSTIRFTSAQIKQIDFGRMFTNSLILLNSPGEISTGLAQELNRYVRSGGNLALFPPLDGKTDSYNALLELLGIGGFAGIDTVKQRIGWLGVESDLFNDVFEKNNAGRIVLPDNVDLPVVSKHYRIRTAAGINAEPLIKLVNNEPFLVSARAERGRIYLFAVPVDDSWSQFPRHTIFVPTMYKMALLSNPAFQLSYTAGENSIIEIPADSVSESNPFKLKKLGSSFEIIPGIRRLGNAISLITHDQIREAGHYHITRGEKQVAGVAFNYDRRESDLDCYSTADLTQQIARLPGMDFHILKGKKTSLAPEIKQIKQGTPLWKLFLLLTLLFIAAEIALIRLMK